MSNAKNEHSYFKKKGFVLVTLVLFLVSLGLHWMFGWQAFVNEQLEHSQDPKVDDYVVEMMRDTFENWRSEFLQLIWQVAGLAFLWHVGSPQSKEGDDRKEAKLDLILKKIGSRKCCCGTKGT
ncbi:MAG: hypothetical protein M3R08_07865 [Bacteroidota bacterium]|nr:hypothetical protein [Bacteroidota bacterium]